jgi:hypothetical protein
MVVQHPMGWRDVAPIGVLLQVPRDMRSMSGTESPKSLCDFWGPWAPRPAPAFRGGLPVGLHERPQGASMVAEKNPALILNAKLVLGRLPFRLRAFAGSRSGDSV